MTDLRHALRLLRRNPGFAAVATLTVALGIGATTAIFSVVNAVLLRPFPYPEPERLVMVYQNDRLRGTDREYASAPDYIDWKAQATSFQHLAARTPVSRNLIGDGEPARLNTARVTASWFAMLGVSPIVGQLFTPEHEQPGEDQVVLLGEGLWRTRFGADPNVVGRRITLDDEPFTIIGVMPVEARIPGFADELWQPYAFQPLDLLRGRHGTLVLGRLRDEVDLASAQSEMSGIMARLEQEYSADNRGRGAFVTPLTDELVRRIEPALLLLLAATGMVLLIACVNVANLLLARAPARTRELAVRSALGAGRRRVTRQLMVESATIAVVGGALGVIVARFGVAGLLALAPSDIPRLEEAGLDGPVLLFALLCATATGLLFGLAPAVRLARKDLQATLREGGRLAGRIGSGARRLLVMSEVALAVVLVVGAGLLVRSLDRLSSVDPGYQSSGLLSMNLTLPAARYPAPQGWPIFEWPALESYTTQVLDRVTAIPGVRSASFGHNSPIDPGWTTRVTVVGDPAPVPGEEEEARYRPVDEEYFPTAGVPLMGGRNFTGADRGISGLVAIVDQAFVRRYFRDREPIGHSISIFGRPREIVGVVGEVKFLGLDQDVQPTTYVPLRQGYISALSLVVRTEGDPSAALQRVREGLWSVDRGVATFAATAIPAALAEQLGDRRFTMILLAVFAVTALSLAGVGVYGVLSSAVASRSQELGIRMALGAGPRAMVGMVVGQGMRDVAIGTAIGLLAAVPLAGLLRSMLFGVTTTDPATYAAVLLVLGVAALAACAIPAARAARVDPMVTLRGE